MLLCLLRRWCSDLKPENVLLDIDGHVKLTDFGLSRYTPAPSPQQLTAAAASVSATTSAARSTVAAAAPAGSGTAGTSSAASGAAAATARPSVPPAAAAIASSFPKINDVVTHSFCGTEQYMAPEVLLQVRRMCMHYC